MVKDEKTTDLHMHTYYSDGAVSPREVVEYAKHKGLKQIAITDHDGMWGIEEGALAAKELNIELIPGIEISAQYYWEQMGINIGIHILGYKLDWEYKPLQEEMKLAKDAREKRNIILLEELNKLGYELELKDITFREGQDYIGKPLIARGLINKGYINSIDEAWTAGGVFEKEQIKKIKKYKTDAKKAIELIHESGGVAILAHPGRLRRIGKQGSKEYLENFSKIFEGLVDLGIDGIEALYQKHSEEEKKFFQNIGEKYKLLITTGSDFHGMEVEEIRRKNV